MVVSLSLLIIVQKGSETNSKQFISLFIVTSRCAWYCLLYHMALNRMLLKWVLLYTSLIVCRFIFLAVGQPIAARPLDPPDIQYYIQPYLSDHTQQTAAPTYGTNCSGATRSCVCIRVSVPGLRPRWPRCYTTNRSIEGGIARMVLDGVGWCWMLNRCEREGDRPHDYLLTQQLCSLVCFPSKSQQSRPTPGEKCGRPRARSSEYLGGEGVIERRNIWYESCYQFVEPANYCR